MRIVKGAAWVAALVLLTACTVAEFDSARAGPEASRVSAARVQFAAHRSVSTHVQRSFPGLASTILYEPVPLDVSQARAATPQFVAVFDEGFRDRFPSLAAARGLTVSPTAQAVLRVSIVGQRTYCYSNCLHRVLLHGELFDASGKVVWRFDTAVGQATAASEISSEMFDAFALEVLKAMKKDGVIGA